MPLSQFTDWHYNITLLSTLRS